MARALSSADCVSRSLLILPAGYDGTAGKKTASTRTHLIDQQAPCCARASTDHAAAAPPRSAMKLRRLISSMQPLRACRTPQNAAYRTLKLPRKYRPVLGVDLNCSESRPPASSIVTPRRPAAPPAAR